MFLRSESSPLMATALHGRLLEFGLIRGLPFASLNSLLSVETPSKNDHALLIVAIDHREASRRRIPVCAGP